MVIASTQLSAFTLFWTDRKVNFCYQKYFFSLFDWTPIIHFYFIIFRGGIEDTGKKKKDGEFYFFISQEQLKDTGKRRNMESFISLYSKSDLRTLERRGGWKVLFRYIPKTTWGHWKEEEDPEFYFVIF